MTGHAVLTDTWRALARTLEARFPHGVAISVAAWLPALLGPGRSPCGPGGSDVRRGLYFANADAIRARILHAAEEDGITAIVIDAETIPLIDVTAARMVAALDQDVRRRDVRLRIARDIGQVRDVLRNVIDDPTLTHVYPSVQSAADEASRRVVEAAR